MGTAKFSDDFKRDAVARDAVTRRVRTADENENRRCLENSGQFRLFISNLESITRIELIRRTAFGSRRTI